MKNTAVAGSVLEGLDPRAGAWGLLPSANPLIEDARQALGRGDLDAWTRALDQVPNEATTRKTLTRLLLISFSAAAAERLEASGRLDADLLLDEALTVNPRVLGWIGRTAEGVARAEAVVQDTCERRVPGKRHNQKQKTLAPRLEMLAARDPQGVLDALWTLDLVAAFGRHDTINTWAPWAHLGMKVLAQVLGSSLPIDEARLAQVTERLIKLPLLAKLLDRESVVGNPAVHALQLDPLVSMALGSAHVEDNPVALGRLDRLIQGSAAVRELMEDYWNVWDAPGRAPYCLPVSLTLFQDQVRLDRLLPGGHRAYSLVDGLLIGARRWVKDAMREGTANGEVFWKAVRRGGNLHCFLHGCSSSEIVALLPKMVETVGVAWRDAQGNNLGHLVAMATQLMEKQALMTLTRLPGGAALMGLANAEGQTPLDLMETSSKWKQGAPEFLARLQEQLARVRRKDLTALGKQVVSERETTLPRTVRRGPRAM